MSWEIIRADQFCDSVRDGTHDTPKEVENGYKLVTAKHIRDGQIYPNEAYNISEKDYIKINERSKVEQWDVVMSMIGNGLGRTAVIKDKPSYAIKNLALFKIGNEVKAKWLHYFLSSEDGQGLIFNSLQGSGQPFISLNLLRAFPIPTPPYKTMENIIGHLEKFDDLIENNQKQIKLLEEAAQRLYKEWFVDLRFPGHETTPIIDGIPEGWEHLDIDKVYLIKYGKTLPTTEISDIGDYPVYGANGVIGYYSNYNCEEYVTLITSRGNGSGDVSRTHHTKAFITNNSFIVTAKEQYDFIKNEFTYWLMKNVDFKSVCTGSAQPQLTYNSISTLKILLPENKTIIMYCEAISKCFEKIEVLLKQNCLLVEARDRLLPKLMSGELEA